MAIRLLLSANKKKEDYVRAVEKCGAEAFVEYLPACNVDYDGLILCGGNDIQPSYYGEEINGSVKFDAARDEAEFALVKAFMTTGKPIFGICRGAQLLNVALGGTLIQHLENVDEHRKDANTETTHEAFSKKGSIFEKLYGERFVINSFHHQALKKLGEGLQVSLLAMDGKTIEGVEHVAKPYFGVQFHPELMTPEYTEVETADGLALFRYFVELCKKHKEL